jgi:hypothetical protein
MTHQLTMDVMAAEDVAKVVVLMCSLPPEVNLYEAMGVAPGPAFVRPRRVEKLATTGLPAVHGNQICPARH